MRQTLTSTCARRGEKTTNKYYKIFASAVYTINANGGSAGLHPSVLKKYFAPVEARALEKTGKELSELTPAEVKAVKKAATVAEEEAATGEYLVCLFLLLADNERYGPLKTQLDTIFLMGEQEYPSDVLAVKGR